MSRHRVRPGWYASVNTGEVRPGFGCGVPRRLFVRCAVPGETAKLPAEEVRAHAERRGAFLALRLPNATVAFTYYQADLLAASEVATDEADRLLGRGCDPELVVRLLI